MDETRYGPDPTRDAEAADKAGRELAERVGRADPPAGPLSTRPLTAEELAYHAAWRDLAYQDKRVGLGDLHRAGLAAVAAAVPQAARIRIAALEAALAWYADAPRDDEGATMPLDLGERARAALGRADK